MTQEIKHTPGPWQIGKSSMGQKGTSKTIWRNDEGPNNPHDTNTNWSVIAQHIHSDADAHLIAAAPDMLELLEEIQEETCKTWCDEEDLDVPHCEECLKAKAVIAKAKGSTPC